MRRYCLALDLIDDPELISAYQEYHKNVWPEIIESIHSSGIDSLEIYLTGNRLFMILEVNDSFSFERKAELDSANPIVQEWEKLMWKYQQGLPWANKGEKWVLMEKIYQM